MGAQETAVEEVLRAAAAEVSTSSVKRRLRIFRHTLPSLLSKATESASDTTLLINLIFQTLPTYDDRASRQAVDDLVVQSLKEATFMKPFAAALIQSMEKNLKVASPLNSFKLLRWSHYLLKWSHFGALSKGAFPRLAHAQAVLCQVLMDGSFRQRRTCKRLFVHLFSEPIGIYKMYLDEIRDLRISTRDSPAFLNLILDFTITSPSLSAEYKPFFLHLYVKTILSSKDRPPKAAAEAFKPLFLDLGHEDFKRIVVPSCIKMLKRNPEIVLQSVEYALKAVCLDLSKYSNEFMPVVLQQARHSDEERRITALNIVGTLSEKSSDPDTLPSMFNSIKAILGGSEGKLSLPYQIIGIINALERLSRSAPKKIGRLAPSVSKFLLTCYKDDGIEEVKLAILSVLEAWASVSAAAIQPDVVSFISAGLKEKDTLRKGHLKLLRVICKKSDSLTQVTSLLDHLIQLSKTGFSKATQRLDGIYALLVVSRLAAVDTKADGAVLKEKLWALIGQNEPSLISVQLLSNLADDDCLTVVDLLQSLLVEHLSRLLIYLVCHPSWEVRKAAYDATTKVLSFSGGLAEDLLFLFSNWLSLVGERLSILKQCDIDSATDSQVPFIPSTEVLVKCLFLIAPYAVEHGSRSYSRVILCSHHPCVSISTSPAAVWKRLQRRLRQRQILFGDLISSNISVICKELFSHDGLFSPNKQEQHAALCSLSTLVTITPDETFLEFEKLFIGLQERSLHDAFSENDIKVFYTAAGQLSTEKGVYVAEAVALKNTKLAKGRFHAYDDQDADTTCSGVPGKTERREPSGTGNRETGKSTKKTAAPGNKAKTANEKARELLLKEDASVCAKVGQVQKNLSLMLDALGELAIANPIFTHGQLPSLVNYVEPLLSSMIVSDAAFGAILRLAHCLAPPLCNWAPQIAAVIRLIFVKNFEMTLDLMPVTMEEDDKKKSSPGLFEQIVNGLTIACKAGPLPADSFTFIFPILEQILLSSEKTCLHDDVLRILSMHMDPILPLPRPKMLSALYHVLSTVPAYHPLVGPMLKKLCLGLRSNELAQALVGVYAKEAHVRLACLTAIKCVPMHSVQQDLHVSRSLWIAAHDPEKEVAELAKDLWDCFGFDVFADDAGISDNLSHPNSNVRAAAAKALAAALDENADKMQDLVKKHQEPCTEKTIEKGIVGDEDRQEKIIEEGKLFKDKIDEVAENEEYSNEKLEQFLLDWVHDGKVTAIQEVDIYQYDVEDLPPAVSNAYLVNLKEEEGPRRRISRVISCPYGDTIVRNWKQSHVKNSEGPVVRKVFQYLRNKKIVQGVRMLEFGMKDGPKQQVLCKMIYDEDFVPSSRSVLNGELRRSNRLNGDDTEAKEKLTACQEVSRETISINETVMQLRKEKSALMQVYATNSEIIANLQKENHLLKSDLHQARATNSEIIANLQKENNLLKSDLHQARLNCNNKSVQVNQLEARLAELIREHEKLLSELEREKSSLKRANDQVDIEKASNKALEEKILDIQGKIRVFCRVRPVRQHETRAVCCNEAERRVVLTYRGQKHSFEYNKIFKEGAAQIDVFKEIRPLVSTAMEGHKISVFAYGQSGSGKTYTMLGNLNSEDEDQKGIIPRCLELVFEKDQRQRGWVYQIKVSIVEIYNEIVQDLLSSKASDAQQIKIQHDSNNIPIISGLIYKDVKSLDEAIPLLKEAIERRSVGKTKINDESSRSHCIFMLSISGENMTTGEKVGGMVNLIDLAGSENISRSGVSGASEKEAQFINKSLSAMKGVIAALDHKNAHIPFRDSKLTHLLMGSLSGGARIVTIINISPEETSSEQTLASLRFGQQACSCEIGHLKVGSPSFSRLKK